MAGKYQKEENLVECPIGCNDANTGCEFNGALGHTELKCKSSCKSFFKAFNAETNKKCEGCVTNAVYAGADLKDCECKPKRW